jgi:hypothetical protein
LEIWLGRWPNAVVKVINAHSRFSRSGTFPDPANPGRRRGTFY